MCGVALTESGILIYTEVRCTDPSCCSNSYFLSLCVQIRDRRTLVSGQDDPGTPIIFLIRVSAPSPDDPKLGVAPVSEPIPPPKEAVISDTME